MWKTRKWKGALSYMNIYFKTPKVEGVHHKRNKIRTQTAGTIGSTENRIKFCPEIWWLIYYQRIIHRCRNTWFISSVKHNISRQGTGTFNIFQCEIDKFRGRCLAWIHMQLAWTKMVINLHDSIDIFRTVVQLFFCQNEKIKVHSSEKGNKVYERDKMWHPC